MFKRANKITALLVAAAAVVSLVPATGVNAADIKKIESKNGIVNNAIAYKDGKFLIDGELEGKEEAVYFLNNGKYTELEDIDSGSDYGRYGEKYATVDGEDYYVDLSSGKVTDDDIESDNREDAETALKKKIKKDDSGRVADKNKNVTLEKIAGSKFGETWYKEEYKVKETSTQASITVYTDAKGAYIDGDYNVGKIKIQTKDGKVELENTKDLEDLKNDKHASVSVSPKKVIGQDKNFIYRLVEVKINSDSEITHLNNKELPDNKKGTELTYTAIQKISKAQSSDDVKGLKYAKTVTTYAVSDEDAKDFSVELVDENSNFTVVNGKIVAYVEKNGKIETRTITLKTKSSYSYTDASDQKGRSYDAIDVDCDGNLWRLDDGNLYKFNNDKDWEIVYIVNGDMKNLEIYDKNNFVVWDSESDDDDKVYSIVAGKSSDKNDTEEVKVGWVQNADGNWSYNKEDGTKATGWLDLNGTWYYLKADGIMATGWVQDGATWYYTNASGAMQTGWVNVNGTWYYLNPVSDGTRGAMKTGWINDNGTWYYCDATGAMLANTTVGGYVLGANGAWVR